MCFFERCEESDGLIVLPEPHVTIADESREAGISRGGLMKRIELAQSAGEIAFLVVGQSEVHARGRVGGLKLEGEAILADGVIEAAEVNQSHREIHAGVEELGLELEELLIIADGGGQIAALLRIDGALEQLVHTRVLGRSAAGKQEREDNNPHCLQHISAGEVRCAERRVLLNECCS